MVYLNRRKAFFVLITKIILSSFFAGTPTSFIFSLTGGLCAFFAMAVFTVIFNKNLLFVSSVLGSVAHNLGQLLAAYIILDTVSVFFYISYFILASLATGFFTGLVSQFTLKKLLKIHSQCLKP